MVLREVVAWVIAAVIMGCAMFFVYFAITPDTRTIKATVGLVEIESGSYFHRVVEIPKRGDIDIKINDKYWIYIDTR